MPDLVCLLARAGATRSPGAEQRVSDLLARQFPSADRRFQVCDVEPLEPENSEPWPVLHVVTEDREFGAWVGGVSHLGQDVTQATTAIVTTAAFDRQYSAYLELFTDKWTAYLDEPTAIGHIDYYNDPIVIDGIASQCWMRTSFVMLPGYLLPEVLDAAVPLPAEEDLFGDDPSHPIIGDFVSDNYKQYLISWLTGEGTGQGVRWHSSRTLAEQGMYEFRMKVRSILREHLFTVKVRQLGATVWDATYLSAATAPDRGLDWRDQLARRPRDAANVPQAHVVRPTARQRYTRLVLPSIPGKGNDQHALGAASHGTEQRLPGLDLNLSTLTLIGHQPPVSAYRVDSPYLPAGSSPKTLVVRDGHDEPRGNWLDRMTQAALAVDHAVVTTIEQDGEVLRGLYLTSDPAFSGSPEDPMTGRQPWVDLVAAWSAPEAGSAHGVTIEGSV